MTHLIGAATWFVPPEEHRAYAAGLPKFCDYQQGYGQSMPKARNVALEWCDENIPAGMTVIQLDDDLKKVARAVNKKRQGISFYEAMCDMLDRLEMSDFRLAGVAPTDNPLSVHKNTSANLFIIGSCIAIKRPCPLYFDEQFRLKSDYDYTLQHVERYGGVVRCNDLLLSFDHYSNAGGVVNYRKRDMNDDMVRRLERKWPGWIRKNPKRPGEILLTVPRRQRVSL